MENLTGKQSQGSYHVAEFIVKQSITEELAKTSDKMIANAGNRNGKNDFRINDSGGETVSGSSSRWPFLKVELCGANVPFHGDLCISFQLRITEPVDPRIVTDSSMGWINQDHFIILPRRRALSGRVDLVTRTMEGSCRYSQHLTLSKNLITSDCFFLHSSDTLEDRNRYPLFAAPLALGKLSLRNAAASEAESMGAADSGSPEVSGFLCAVFMRSDNRLTKIGGTRGTNRDIVGSFRFLRNPNGTLFDDMLYFLTVSIRQRRQQELEQNFELSTPKQLVY
nr:hypothetical protein Iba_chr11aCG9170 [Ipomoea batatas]